MSTHANAYQSELIKIMDSVNHWIATSNVNDKYEVTMD